MASKYWLKLYHEMLDDPKVARLNDSAYRRFIECLLLAGELDDDGLLPPLEDMAWRIRVSEIALTQDMTRLALGGMVELKEHEGKERWFVSKFEERQSPMEKAEYMRRKRKQEKKEEYYQDCYQPVTNGNTDTDTDTDTDHNSGFGSVVTSYENNIALITPIIAEEIQAAVDEFGEDDVVEAIGLAVKADVRKWNYVNAILKSWRKNGKRQPTNGNQQSKPEQVECLLSIISKYGKHKLNQAKPELEKAGMLPAIKRMGGWSTICRMREKDIKFAYYAAVKT